MSSAFFSGSSSAKVPGFFDLSEMKSAFFLRDSIFPTMSFTIWAIAGEHVRPGLSMPNRLINPCISFRLSIIKSLNPFSSGEVCFGLKPEKLRIISLSEMPGNNSCPSFFNCAIIFVVVA